MKIVYVGREEQARRSMLASEDDILLLLYDRWDDFGYKTRFPTECRIGGEIVELGAVRILFDEEQSSHPHLALLRQAGWDGVFPVEGSAYISVPEEITFYEQLQSQPPFAVELCHCRAGWRYGA